MEIRLNVFHKHIGPESTAQPQMKTRERKADFRVRRLDGAASAYGEASLSASSCKPWEAINDEN